MSNIITAEKLQALTKDKPPLRCDPVAVPEFGAGAVAYIAELTAYEREQRIELPFQDFKASTNQEDNAGVRAHLIAACLCTDQSRSFEAKAVDAIRSLAALLNGMAGDHANAVQRLSNKAGELNALSEESQKK